MKRQPGFGAWVRPRRHSQLVLAAASLSAALLATCPVAAQGANAKPAGDPAPPAPSTEPVPVDSGDVGLEPLAVDVRGPQPSSQAKAGATAFVMPRQTLESLPGGDSQPLSHALATQPGFVADTFGFGIHVHGSDGGILYVIDGVPMPASPLGQWGGNLSFLPSRLVSSLRTTTGGFPAEYGSVPGAVVEVTTRRAVGGPAGEAQVSYGTYNRLDASLNYSQEIGHLNFFAGGNLLTSARGIDPPSVSPILHDATEQGNGFLRADYQLGDDERIQFFGVYTQSRFQIPIDPTVSPLSQAPIGAVRGLDVYGDPAPPYVPPNANPVELEKNVFVTASYFDEDANSRLQVTPYVRQAVAQLACDPSRTLGASADPGSSCSDVTRDELHEGVSVNLSWRSGAHHAWKTGATADFTQSHVNYTTFTRHDASAAGGPDASKAIRGSDVTQGALAGVFLQDRITLGKWTVFPGVRIDLEHASFLESNEPALLIGGPGVRLGASYSATSDLIVHAFAGYQTLLPTSTIDAPVAARILIPSLAGRPLPVDLKPEQDYLAEFGITDRLWNALTVGFTVWGRLSTDLLDRQNIGSTNLVATYNFARGRGTGLDTWCNGQLGKVFTGFANLSWQMAEAQGIDSERFLFGPEQVASKAWEIIDDVQSWTLNVGGDLHDPKGTTHLSSLVQYGSGMRAGPLGNQTVPPHVTMDVTLRHRFDWVLRPEVALDVLNVFNEVYAFRIATGYSTGGEVGSAYGPLRQVRLRLSVPFGGTGP